VKSLPGNDYEAPFWASDQYVAGVDEAGRGCLAGPVAAAAVILPKNFINTLNINDSKKLTHSQRMQISQQIIDIAIDYRIEFVDNHEIDKINILQATLIAMQKSCLSLRPRPHHLLIDGNRFNSCKIAHTTIIEGDAKCVSIAAASILAKVYRDLWMIEIADKLYPDHNFAQHKGYGTKLHYEAIKKHGITPIHRKSFLKNLDEHWSLFENEHIH
jgi:ribonuclease HII